MLVNGFCGHFGAVSCCRRSPRPKLAIVRRRARLIGWRQALGQAAFGVVQKLIIARAARRRLAAIWERHGLDPRPDPAIARARGRLGELGSVPRDALRELRPDVVVVYGTRIIKRATLRCVAAPFINYHAGVNPKYRGQNGAYWARSNARSRACRRHRAPGRRGRRHRRRALPGPRRVRSADNIATYQHRQMAVALPLLIRAVEDALAGRLAPRRVELPSRQWFHPTLWAYFRTGLAQGVW